MANRNFEGEKESKRERERQWKHKRQANFQNTISFFPKTLPHINDILLHAHTLSICMPTGCNGFYIFAYGKSYGKSYGQSYDAILSM